MQIDSLRYFYDVATLKSISKVAQQSHISQPALSQQLLKLEKKLGVTLLNRSNKGVELTKEGEILLKYSKEIILSYDHLLEELEELEQNENNLVLEVNSVPGNFLISASITEILKQLKGYYISFNENYENNPYINLLHNKVQIVIGNEKLEEENLVSTYIGEDEIVAVVGKNTLGNNMELLPEIVFENNILKNVNIKSNSKKVLLRTNSLHTAKQMLQMNISYCFLPKMCIKEELNKGTLKIISENNIKYPFYITYKKDIKRSLKSKINSISTKLQYKLKCD